MRTALILPLSALSQSFAMPTRAPLSRQRPRLAPLAVLLLVTAVFIIPSTRAANVWTRQKSNTLAWLHAVYFLNAQKGWAVGGNGVLLATDDGGTTWRALRRPTEDTLRDIYFKDESTGWLVCERNIYLLKTEDEPRTYLLHTIDGGATWQRLNIIKTNPDERLVRFAFVPNGTRGWAFGEAGALYATRDGGDTWLRQRVPTRKLLLGGVFLDADTGWLVGAGATVLQTTDGGDTWNAATLLDKTSDRLNAVTFADPAHGWAVGANGSILYTVNGGRTWRTQTSNVSTDLYDVKFINYAEGWATGAEGVVLHTMNGGARWILEQSGTTHPLERLYATDRTHVRAVGFGGTIIAYDATDTNSPRQTTPQLRPRAVH